MKRRTTLPALALLTAALTLSGCFWRGYKEPAEFDFKVASPAAGSPRIGTQNLSEADAATILEAAAEACALMRGSEFRQALSVELLRERCSSSEQIAGAEILRLLTTELPDFSVIARKPPSSEAVTLASSQRMAIRPGRFDDWRAGGERRSYMINTLVHEMTHLIPADDGSRFQDEGHGSSSCPDRGLVSYRTGELAQVIWNRSRS